MILLTGKKNKNFKGYFLVEAMLSVMILSACMLLIIKSISNNFRIMKYLSRSKKAFLTAENRLNEELKNAFYIKANTAYGENFTSSGDFRCRFLVKEIEKFPYLIGTEIHVSLAGTSNKIAKISSIFLKDKNEIKN